MAGIDISKINVPLVLVAGAFMVVAGFGAKQWWRAERQEMSAEFTGEITKLRAELQSFIGETTHTPFGKPHYRAVRIFLEENYDIHLPEYEDLRVEVLKRESTQ